MERIQRTVGELLGETTWPELSPDASVTQALDAMAREGVDSVLVVEDHVLTGIFTSRDFLYRVAAEGRIPSDVRLADVMTREPQTLKRHDCITYAINRMATRNIRNLPIVDDENRPLGVLRIWDVIAHLNDVFEEIAQLPAEPPTDDMWLDLGGG
jgi:CBS domain-containing protein